MTSRTILVCLSVAICSIYSVTGYKYKDVSLCPNVAGDPSFTIGTVTGVLREIYATTSKIDANTDRCIAIKKGIFYVTNMDSDSLTLYKFKSLFDQGKGTFTETGPDGKSYKVIVLKSYGPECGNMNLLVRCSDSVGKASNPIIVKIHADNGAKIKSDCLIDAKTYANKVLNQKVKFYILKNNNCITIDGVCSATS